MRLVVVLLEDEALVKRAFVANSVVAVALAATRLVVEASVE